MVVLVISLHNYCSVDCLSQALQEKLYEHIGYNSTCLLFHSQPSSERRCFISEPVQFCIILMIPIVIFRLFLTIKEIVNSTHHYVPE